MSLALAAPLAAARRIGDFYTATAGRFLDPAGEAEGRMTGSYAAGYVTDYFAGIEGLARRSQTTRDPRYLRQAERMADFFQRFNGQPIDHSHGNFVTHYGRLRLYEVTGKSEYLQRPLAQWQRAVAGGFVWLTGGVGERFRVSCATDEGCSEADWLRLNLRWWELTAEARCLDQAGRLIWNHYAMNRTTNGGYGHHQFTSVVSVTALAATSLTCSQRRGPTGGTGESPFVPTAPSRSGSRRTGGRSGAWLEREIVAMSFPPDCPRGGARIRPDVAGGSGGARITGR